MKTLYIFILGLLIFSFENCFSQLSCYHVVIDAGHGGSDPGSSCYNGTDEKALTLEMTLALRTNLLGKGVTVAMTRTTDVFVALTDRRDFINNENPDVAICMHLNAYNGVVQGTETYWCAGAVSTALANAVQPQLIAAIGYADRGVKNTCYTVLTTSTSIPAILTESLFHDEPNGCTFINSPANQAIVASAHATGIVNYLPVCSTLANDACTGAIQLQNNTVCNYTSGTISGASTSMTTKPSCDVFGSPAQKDVFYYFIATDTAHTVEVNPTGTGADAVDAVVSVYTGTNCSALAEVACAGGTGGSGGVTKFVDLSGLTIGQKYWIRIYDYGTVDPVYPGFEICVTSDVQTHAANNISAGDFVNIYPNPSNDIINIDASFKIDEVIMKNCIGQIIFEKEVFDSSAKFNISYLKSGFYFIEIRYEGRMIIQKLVKQ